MYSCLRPFGDGVGSLWASSFMSDDLRSILPIPRFVGGQLQANGWENNCSDPINVLDSYGLLTEVPAGEFYVPGGRYEQNLAAETDSPSTQNITVISGNQYSVTIEGESGSTAVLSNAATATLTNNGTDPITTNNGTPVTASSSTLTVTISGNVTRLRVHNVTSRSNQNPPEYLPVGTEDGVELNPNPTFSKWGDPTVPDGWLRAGTYNESNYVEEHPDGCRLVSDGTYIAIYRDTLEIGETYVLNVSTVELNPSESLQVYCGSVLATLDTSYTEATVVFTATATRIDLKRSAAVDAVITNLSIQKATTGFAIYDHENGNTVDGSGVVTEAEGDLLDPAPVLTHVPGSTNKCTNWNLRPTDLTNLTKSGDAAATLSLVDDSVNYPDKLKQLGNGFVFKLDNSAGSTDAYVSIGGQVANLNPHSFQLWARETEGVNSYAYLLSDTSGKKVISGATYSKYVSENLTPTVTNRVLRVRAEAGGVVYFIGNQLEEKSFATPLIETAGAAVSRNSTAYRQALELDTNFKQSAGTLIFDWMPEYDINAVNTNSGMFSIQDNAAGPLYHGLAGALSYDGANATTEITINSNGSDKYRAAVRWSDSEMQVGIKNITTDSAWSWTAAATYDGEFNAGSYINLFYSNDYINQLHDIKLFGKALTTEQIEAKYS